MAIDFGVLKTEVETDPLGLGYTTSNLREDNVLDAELLNNLNTGRTKAALDVPTHDILSKISRVDYENLGVGQPADVKRDLLLLLLVAQTIDMTDQVTAELDSIFSGTDTLTRIQPLYIEPVSRAEELFGDGDEEDVGYWDVRIARNL